LHGALSFDSEPHPTEPFLWSTRLPSGCISN
jgi:hypothetical protein